MNSQPEHDKQLPVSAIAALHDGQKTKAIKIIRKEQGIDLKQAKDTVDNYLTTHPELQSRIDRQHAKFVQHTIKWLLALALLIFLILYL